MKFHDYLFLVTGGNLSKFLRIILGRLANLYESSGSQFFRTTCSSTETIPRSSPSEVFLRKAVLKICSKFTREHPRRSVISIKLLCNFNEITLRHECSPVNLLHIFRTPFYKNISEWLLLCSP